MFDRLEQLEARYEELGRQMSDPDAGERPGELSQGGEGASRHGAGGQKFREYRKILDGIAEAKPTLADPDPR